jgi:hypothetical protein
MASEQVAAGEGRGPGYCSDGVWVGSSLEGAFKARNAGDWS